MLREAHTWPSGILSSSALILRTALQLVRIQQVNREVSSYT